MKYEARSSSDGWYIYGSDILYWRCPSRDLAEAVVALLNGQPDHAAEILKRWRQT